MDSEPKEEGIESSEEETDSFDNYGVFQSDYEFKFVQEGNDKTTLMLPPVTYDSMDVKYFNIEIEVESELHVSALEKEMTDNGTTKYFFRIAKHRILAKTEKGESVEALGEDGYEDEEMVDAADKEKGKAKKTRTPMDAHNYSKPKAVSTACQYNYQGGSETHGEKKKPAETVKVKVEALDGTQIDQDSSSIVEYADTEDLDAEDIDDGDDDLDDFEEIEIAGHMSSVQEQNSDSYVTPKRRGQKRKMGASSEKKRKYTRTNHYSKDSSNFTVELTDEGEKIYRCGFCEHTSRFAGNMCDHVRTHTLEKPFVCPICGQSFKRADSLNAHKVKHKSDKDCMCDHCGKFFKSKKAVYNHTLAVHREKKCKCPYCNRCFCSNYLLVQHMSVHTGEKNHKCQHCAYTVSSASSLKRHLLVHTGEQKFHCHVCSKGFNRKEYFRDHMIKCHNYTGKEDFLVKAKRSKPSTYTLPVYDTPTTETEVSEISEDQVYTIEEVVLSVMKEEESVN